MPKKLFSYMNNGRWLIHCPKCDTALPAQESGVICPRCHPGMLAKAYKMLPSGLLRPVADVDLIQETLIHARSLNEEYFPEWPPDKAEIERILRLRPAAKHMNWHPGETLADLRLQNIQHGDPVPEEE
jgi:hypothetical protein